MEQDLSMLSLGEQLERHPDSFSSEWTQSPSVKLYLQEVFPYNDFYVSGETRQTNTFVFSKIFYNRLRTADINAGSDTAAVSVGKRWEAVECLNYIRGPRAFPLDRR